MARWKIGGNKTIPLTIVLGNKFIATGSIDIDLEHNHFHVNLKQDTFDMIMEQDHCEFTVRGKIRGFGFFAKCFEEEQININEITEVLIEEVALTVEE